MPYAAWIISITIHHSETPIDSTPTRTATSAAARQVTSRCQALWTSQSTGAGTIIAKAVALTAPTVSTIRAIAAGSPQVRRRVARTVKPTIQPSPAHGSSITDVRDTYGSTYSEVWYTTAAARAAATDNPSRRTHQRTPSPAASMIVPIHSRWAIQSGTPSASNTQNHGPAGHR